MMLGDGVAQGRASRDFRIVGVAMAQRRNRGFRNGARRGEIWVANAQNKHLFTATSRGQGLGVNVPRLDRFAR